MDTIRLRHFDPIKDTGIIALSEMVFIIGRQSSGKSQNARIVRKQSDGTIPYNTKLSYIPAERNLISAVRNINSVYKTKDRDVLFNFIQEWNESKEDAHTQTILNHSFIQNYMLYLHTRLDMSQHYATHSYNQATSSEVANTCLLCRSFLRQIKNSRPRKRLRLMIRKRE